MTSAGEAMGDAASVSRSESRSERCAGRRRRACISPSGLSSLGLWCVLASGRVRGALGQTETSAWLNRAAALQRYIGYDIPLDKLTLTATHNSFSSDRDISTHANFEVVTAQVYGITNQLSCLGVRGLELDLHYIEELAEEGEEESAIRLCHASEDVAEQMLDLCETFGWDVCEEADIFDYGEDTGCRPGAPTAREGFEEVAAWLFLEENASEVVFIKLDSSLNDEDDRISTLVSEVFGDDVIFSPADWEEYSGSEDWPSPAELVELGTRVVIAGSEPSTLVFSTDDDVEEDITSAQNFDANTCDEVDDFPEPSWHRVQGDMVEYRLVRGNSTIFELVPGSDEALTATMTGNVMNCGLTPTFDRLDAELMESTVWSWATDRPETGFAESRAAVVTVSEGGRWTDVDSSEGGDARHSFACRNSDDDQRHDWVVVPVAPSSTSTNAGSSTISSRRAVRRGRRRRLYTSGGYNYDEGDDGYGYGYDYETSDDGEAEYSDYNGEFSEAVEACESVGYVFGAPRTAYENAWLRIVMEEAEVDTAWINHTSEGEDAAEDAGSSLCWSREGGTSYCVDTSDTCSEEADPVTEVADGELPYFQVADWEDIEYVRPDYVVPSTVEILHGWVRVAGDNEFDLSERAYVVGIILAAVPVFIFGFIVACCCLPVGHIAASSKEHHVDGSGFFGCFCPSRCKRGDFMGSGTLGVVLFFTIFTIIGGAVAIYGVQSVDSDITHMVTSLQGMGADMVEAQTGVESIYGFLGSVEESFEEISSCSLVSSLEGVEAGISSAKSAVEDLVEDDELGSVGSDILGVEEAFSNTGDTRRGVVYCASALVLLMSAIYVVVGYYALRKDDGRGKEGGASMRGPVLIGCLILPLTLLVILLCWFLFGLSTSVALLTSDFCVAPSEHTTEAFSDPADQEVVAFYTSCEGPNVFSDQLATAYLQGTAAQGLLDAIDDDDFAAECPDDVASKAALDDDIAAILAQIDTLGYLVQCSRVNPYFVEGVEESICVNATSDVWFVIGGFAVVSVGLFIVAVSFRLLLQQKEEGLYKVVFEDELAVSVASSSVYSDDSFSGANGYGNGGTAASSQAGRGAAISAKSLSYNDSSRWGGSGAGKGGGGGGGARVGEKQHQHSASSSSSSTLPSSVSPTPQGFGGRHGVAAVAVAGAWRDPQQQQQQQQPRRSEAGGGGAPGRATPVELAMPLSRSAGGGGKRAASVVSDAGPDEHGGNGARGPSVFDSSSEEDGDGGHRRRGGAGGGVAGAVGGVAGAAAVSRGRSRRSNGSSNGRSGRHHRDHHGHHHHGHHHGHHHDDLGSHSGKSRPTRLFRALAGLDDPTEEAPSVIVSRYATQRSTRNLGGGGGSGGDVGGSGRLTYTFGRTSSVVGGSNRRNHAAPSSDSGESAFADDFSDHDESRGGGGGGGGGGHGAGVRRSSAGAGSGRRGTSGRGRGGGGGGGGGEHSANEAAEFSSHGTWAAFSRDCARKGAGGPFLSNSTEVQDPRGRSGRSQRRSSSGGTRESHHHHGTAGAKDPGFEAAGGAPGSPESSTVSGLTGWRRQRLQQRAVSQRSSQRAARDARTATAAAASAAGPGRAGAEERGEAKHDEGSPGPGESGRDGRGSLRKVGGPANARVSARPWHKAGAGAAVQEGGAGAGAATAPPAPAGAGTGMKGLSALSRPSPAENAAEAKRKLKLKLGPRGSADTSGRSTAAGAKRVDQAITKGARSPLTSAPRERSASVSQRAAPGGGGGGGGRGRGAGSRAPAAAAGAGAAAGSSVRRAVAVTGTAQGASSRPGTRMTDVLGDRGAGGDGVGGGGGGGGSRNRGPSRSGRHVA